MLVSSRRVKVETGERSDNSTVVLLEKTGIRFSGGFHFAFNDLLHGMVIPLKPRGFQACARTVLQPGQRTGLDEETR